MQFNHTKRSLSLLLALVMIVSVMPVNAFAAGLEHHDHAQPEALSPLAASGTVLSGQITVTDTASNVSVSGSTVTVTVKGSGALFSSSTATLKLTNFSLTAAKESSNVTVDFDSTMGSVTAGGTAVTAGTTIEGVTPGEGIALVAKPASGYGFAPCVRRLRRHLCGRPHRPAGPQLCQRCHETHLH